MNEPKTILEPIAGYFMDSFRKLQGVSFVPHSLTKLQNIRYCRKKAGATTAIEVGSFKGITTQRLARIFKSVESIEIDPALHKVATERCRKFSNTTIHLGDGSALLPKIAAQVNNALIFLDGHYSGSGTGIGDEPEPVLKELDSIQPNMENFVAVVIDDFRLFGVEEGWPKKSEVLSKVERIFSTPAWTICIQYDQILITREPACHN